MFRSTNTNTQKKSAILLLCLLGGSAAVTVTYYSDGGCNTALGNSFQGVSNPLVVPLTTCVLSRNAESIVYIKATSCSTTTSISVYTDSNCNTLMSPVPPGSPWSVGTCVNTNLPPGAGSLKFTCSSASAASVTLFVAVAALVSLCA
jgi:hypothetical protein